jgi:hypothetical protein
MPRLTLALSTVKQYLHREIFRVPLDMAAAARVESAFWKPFQKSLDLCGHAVRGEKG